MADAGSEMNLSYGFRPFSKTSTPVPRASHAPPHIPFSFIALCSLTHILHMLTSSPSPSVGCGCAITSTHTSGMAAPRSTAHQGSATTAEALPKYSPAPPSAATAAAASNAAWL
ncbi:hypothetical protein Vafri_2393 [Volvox africanus]|nr:hypothetical protein Vafri_2393 [Volvox africanus]